MYKFVLPVAVAAVLIALHAWPQGIWSRRWGAGDVTEEQKIFAERLKNIPTSFGDWDSEDVPISQRELDASGSTGSFSRRFFNRNAPEKSVLIFIVSGNSYDVTMHTPDQCYVLSGFQEAESQDRYVVDTGKTAAEFATNRFRRSGTLDGPQHLRIFWSFSGDGEWVAPTTPKLSLMSSPALFKIYAQTVIPGDTALRPEESPAVPFLREFMPMLTTALFPADKSAPNANGATPAANSPDGVPTPAAATDAVN